MRSGKTLVKKERIKREEKVIEEEKNKKVKFVRSKQPVLRGRKVEEEEKNKLDVQRIKEEEEVVKREKEEQERKGVEEEKEEVEKRKKLEEEEEKKRKESEEKKIEELKNEVKEVKSKNKKKKKKKKKCNEEKKECNGKKKKKNDEGVRDFGSDDEYDEELENRLRAMTDQLLMKYGKMKSAYYQEIYQKYQEEPLLKGDKMLFNLMVQDSTSRYSNLCDLELDYEIDKASGDNCYSEQEILEIKKKFDDWKKLSIVEKIKLVKDKNKGKINQMKFLYPNEEMVKMDKLFPSMNDVLAKMSELDKLNEQKP